MIARLFPGVNKNFQFFEFLKYEDLKKGGLFPYPFPERRPDRPAPLRSEGFCSAKTLLRYPPNNTRPNCEFFGEARNSRNAQGIGGGAGPPQADLRDPPQAGPER
jgi:hypothetical protein